MAATNEQLEEMLLDIRDATPGGLQQREVISLFVGPDSGRQPMDRLTQSEVIEALHTLKKRGFVTSNISKLRSREQHASAFPVRNSDQPGPHLVIYQLTKEGETFMAEAGLF